MGVERKHSLRAAALCGLLFAPFIHQEILERTEQEGTKSATVRVGQAQIFLLEQPGEELLRQITSIVRIVALAPNAGIERIPISPAEFFQGFGSLRGISLARLQDDAPVRGDKAANRRQSRIMIVHGRSQGSTGRI